MSPSSPRTSTPPAPRPPRRAPKRRCATTTTTKRPRPRSSGPKFASKSPAPLRSFRGASHFERLRLRPRSPFEQRGRADAGGDRQHHIGADAESGGAVERGGGGGREQDRRD